VTSTEPLDIRKDLCISLSNGNLPRLVLGRDGQMLPHKDERDDQQAHDPLGEFVATVRCQMVLDAVSRRHHHKQTLKSRNGKTRRKGDSGGLSVPGGHRRWARADPDPKAGFTYLLVTQHFHLGSARCESRPYWPNGIPFSLLIFSQLYSPRVRIRFVLRPSFIPNTLLIKVEGA
jgi:hypothetical protein